MIIGAAPNTAHPDVSEIVPSDHCVHRFRQRWPVRAAGIAPVAAELLRVLGEADVSRWAPGWAMSDEPAELWAVAGELAFPLARTGVPGRWLALTCLVRRGA